MSLTRTQVESWDPATLSEIGSAWLAMGKNIEDLFDQYKAAVANVNGGHWQGVAADAALARADSDRRAAIGLVDHLDRVANIAIVGFHQVDAPLQQARHAIAGAEYAGFAVSEDLTVSKPNFTTIEGAIATTEGLFAPVVIQQAIQRWQKAIAEAATAAETADNSVRNELAAARKDLRVAFVSAETLSPEQARSDAAQLLSDPSRVTPVVEQRLVDAGLLTPAQLSALQSGDPVMIPAAQMEYLNALARSLDGKSPQDIEAIMDELPPDARQGMANALQLVSTPSVTASVRGDSLIPTAGAATLLPRQMYQSLTRKDLATQGWQIIGDSGYNVISLNGVAANRASAGIAAMSSPALRHQTGLDTAVFKAAATYLHSQVIAQHNPDDMYFVDGKGQQPTASLTEPLFHAVAEDKGVVSAELRSPNGQAFLCDVFNNKWSDHGKSISQVFEISSQDALAAAGDRPSEVRAAESGRIAETVARYMSDHSKQLLDLPGDPGAAVGQRNPDLVINLATDLAPYYSTFAGSESIPGVGHFENSNQLADMYAVLASSPRAGVDAAIATWGQQNAMATAYGAGQAPYTYAQIAGQMQHALETGTASAQSALNDGDVYKADWKNAVANADYGAAYKAAYGVVGFIPEVGRPLASLINVGGTALQPYVVGIVDPRAVVNPSNGVPYEHVTNQLDTNTTVQDIVNGLVIKDPSVVNDPALAPYRHTDAQGNPSLTVDNLQAQGTISDLLKSRYDLDAQQWEYQFATGKNGGTIVPAR